MGRNAISRWIGGASCSRTHLQSRLILWWVGIASVALSATVFLVGVNEGIHDFESIVVSLIFISTVFLPALSLAVYQWTRMVRQRQWLRKSKMGRLASILVLQALATINSFLMLFIASFVWSTLFDEDRDLIGSAAKGASIPSIWQLAEGLAVLSIFIVPMVVLPRVVLARHLRHAGVIE